MLESSADKNRKKFLSEAFFTPAKLENGTVQITIWQKNTAAYVIQENRESPHGDYFIP